MKRSAILAGLVLIGYRQALGVGFLSDDFVHLTGARLNTLSLQLFAVAPDWIFYRPLGALAWLVQARLFGDHAMAYHLVSLGLHALSSLLVMHLATRLAPGRDGMAFGAGVIFALLPLNDEAVGWLAGQYDLLATVGILAALLWLIGAWRERRVAPYLLSLAAFQFALWSKEAAFTLPALVVILALLMPDRPSWRLAGASLVGYASLLAVNLALRVHAWGGIGGYSGVSHDYPSFAWDRLASALVVLLAPFNRPLFPAPLVQVWLLAMSVLVLAGLMTGRNRRLIVVSLAWIIVTTLPVLALLPVGADLQGSRFLYVPAVGFSLGLAALVDALSSGFVPARRQAGVFLAVGVLAVAFVAILTVQLGPWLVASRVVRQVVDDLHRLVPRFGPDSTLQVEGLPFNYLGAHVFRLGFDHAFTQRYSSRFILDPVEKLGSLGDGEADQYQIVYAYDAGQARWPLVAAKGITATNWDWPMPRSSGAEWDFTQCGAEAGWQHIAAEFTCRQGLGLNIAPSTADPYLVSPPLELPTGKWLEVRVEMETPPGVGRDAAAQLFWHMPADWFGEDRSVRIELPVGGGRRIYHFFVPPDPVQAVSQLRLDPVDGVVPVVLMRISARPVP